MTNFNNYIFSSIITSITLLFFAPVRADVDISPITQIDSLSQISVDQPKSTLFLFDLDDTIFDSVSMLGSKAWRKYIVDATKSLDTSENWHDIFSYALAQKHPLITVEQITSSFVKNLQNKGYVVCGLTARERNFWYDRPQRGIDALTVTQLSSVDVDFNNGSLENAYPYLSTDAEYFNGIFFANLEPKGTYILHLFENASEWPQKVIFIDDKAGQVESVSKALTHLGIPHEGYIYTATDKKAKSFNPLIANIQLFYFYESNGQRILSNREASLIMRSDPEKNAEYYLKATIDIAKKQIRD